SALATKYGVDITELSTTITSLNNGTTYYVWVKAKNSARTSDFSSMGTGTPVAPIVAPQAPTAPAEPRVTAGNTQLMVSWTVVNGATAYEVWTGTANNSALATKYGVDITELSTTITSLNNGTTYYVWVKAKNSAGISGFSQMASGIPRALVDTSIIITLAPQNDVSLPSQSTYIVPGESGTFQVTGSYPSYRWYLDGTAISGAVFGSYTLNTASMFIGVYELSVVVSTDADELLSGTCYVRVQQFGISDITYSRDTWALQGDGRRKSPTIGDSGTTITRCTFASTGSDVSLVIHLDVSSEANYDFAFVGNLDSTASMSSCYDKISGSTSQTIIITIPTAGSHFVEIGYGKDGSVSNGSDCAWFMIE
ncbi:MAG: fibronectin type III domain-containing protein, partial [Treponema sp.]|nr:fibronectin type III domain-containing protein [Treponema sp.]